MFRKHTISQHLKEFTNESVIEVIYDAQESTQDLEVLSLNSACIYGKPKNIIIFSNFKGILSSKQPQTVTTIQNYYGIVISSISLFHYGK